MKRKITALCICLTLIASFFVMTPVAAATKSEAALMFDLGIVQSLPKSGLVKETFNRGMFAVSLSLMDGTAAKGYVSDEEISKYASDIAAHADKAAIAEALAGGFMETVDGKFMASQPLSEEVAIKAFVRKLGYEPLVAEQGGTVNAYYDVARRVGLLRGVTIANSAALTDSEVAALMANAMNIIVHPTRDCFYNCWKLTKRTGKILANSSLGLLSPRTNAGRVNIDGVIYQSNIQVPNELVGSKVTFYTDAQDGKDKIVSIYVDVDPETLTISADAIESVATSGSKLVITYNEDDKIYLDKSGFVMVNGTTKSPSVQLFNALKGGSATFIDSDADGIYDVVHFNLMVYDLIDGVSAEAETVVTKFARAKLSAKAIKNFEVFINGKTADISELKAGMVIGIACDSFTISGSEISNTYNTASYIRIEASTRQVSGKVTNINQSGKIVVDGMSYKLGAGYNYFVDKSYVTPLPLGGYLNFYLDTEGKIVYYQIDPLNDNMGYGYLIAVGVEHGAFDPELKLKIMDKTGKIDIYSSANHSFILDGYETEVLSGTTYVLGGSSIDLSKRQAVRFRVVDGVLRELDTAVVTAVEDGANTIDVSMDLDPYASSPTSREIQDDLVNRQFGFTGKTVIFRDEAPINQTNPANRYFSVMNYSSLPRDTGVYVMGFDHDEMNTFSCAIYYGNLGSSGSGTTRELSSSLDSHIVESIVTGVDENGETVWEVSLAGTGQHSTYKVPLASLEFYEYKGTNGAAGWGEGIPVTYCEPETFGTKVKPGDIVRFTTNLDGEITYFEKDVDFATYKGRVEPIVDKDGSSFCFANVVKTNDTLALYSYGDALNNPSEPVYTVRRRFSTMPVFNVKKGTVTMMAMQDIPAAVTGQNVKVFIQYYDRGKARNVFFYLYD